MPKSTSIPQTTSHGHEGAAVLGAEDKLNHIEVSKADRKPAEQTNEISTIEEEVGAMAVRRASNVGHQKASFSQQADLGIQLNDLAAQERLERVEFDEDANVFINEEFHNQLLLSINDKILGDINRVNGVSETPDQPDFKETAAKVAKKAVKAGIGIVAGTLGSPLLGLAVEAGFDLVSKAAEKLVSNHYKKKSKSVLDRLSEQQDKNPNASLSGYSSAYSFAEMVTYNFYEKYSESLNKLNFSEMSQTEKAKLSKRFKDALFSDASIKDARSHHGEKLLVDCAEDKIRAIFKDYGVEDSTYELSKAESLA